MIIFFGAPGSGKSTQAQLLAKQHDWRWISTGELFRQSNDPELQKILASGELVSDEVTNRILAEAIGDDYDVILDGYPRNLDQATLLINKYGKYISGAILLEVTKDEIVQRVELRGRAEDDAETAIKRLEIYNRNTAPILEFLQKSGIKLTRINGVGEIDTIQQCIEQAIQNFSFNKNTEK